MARNSIVHLETKNSCEFFLLWSYLLKRKSWKYLLFFSRKNWWLNRNLTAVHINTCTLKPPLLPKNLCQCATGIDKKMNDWAWKNTKKYILLIFPPKKTQQRPQSPAQHLTIDYHENKNHLYERTKKNPPDIVRKRVMNQEQKNIFLKKKNGSSSPSTISFTRFLSTQLFFPSSEDHGHSGEKMPPQLFPFFTKIHSTPHIQLLFLPLR